jgi:MFS family permease
MLFVFTVAAACARLFLSPMMGRVNRRGLLMGSDVFRSGLLVVPTVLAVFHSLYLWQLYALVVLIAIVGTPYVPIRGAFLKDIVDSRALSRANAWMQGPRAAWLLWVRL